MERIGDAPSPLTAASRRAAYSATYLYIHVRKVELPDLYLGVRTCSTTAHDGRSAAVDSKISTYGRGEDTSARKQNSALGKPRNC